MYRFSYTQNKESRPLNCGREDFEKLIDSTRVKRLCDRVAAETDHKKQNVIKVLLPTFLFHATFPKGRRLKSEGVPSGLCMLDFDHVDNPAGLWEKIKEQALSMGCLVAHMTPSTRGLRLVMPLIGGMDVPNSQAEYALRFGIDKEINDEVVTDLSRCSFVVPRSYFYYIDWEGLFEGEAHEIKNEEPKTSKTKEQKKDVASGHDGKGGKENDGNDNKEGAGAQPAVPAAGNNGVANEYLGIPFSEIIREWLREYLSNKPGYTSFDAPCEGDRNNTLYDLCRDLRNITDYNFSKLSAIVPRWGLTEGEVDNTVASAIKADRRSPFILNKVLRKLQASKGEQGEEGFKAEMYLFNEQYLSRMPKLPAPLQACLEGVERKYHMPIIVGTLPLLCSYADKVMYRYSDGRFRRPNLLSFILGKFASGKSSVTSKLDILMQPMKEADEVAREKDEEAREQNNTRKDSERGKVNKDFVKKLNIDTTDAALLRMQKIAAKQGNSIDGRLLPLKNFMFTEEASSVKQAMKNGKIMEAWRVAFDNGEWGKDTASDTAQAGLVKMSLDITAECTIEVFSKLINGENFENGTASRLLLSFTPDEKFAHMPKFREESKQTRELMLEAVRLCREEKGIIDDKKLCKAFEDWCNGIADECGANGDNVRDDFRKRSSVIGATCALICAILWNKHSKSGKLVITREAIEFGLLMAEYCMESQVAVFKQYYEKEPARISFSGAYKMTKNKVLFDELPEVFTREMVKEKKKDLSRDTIYKFINGLKRDNLIEEISKNTYRKLTPRGMRDEG